MALAVASADAELPAVPVEGVLEHAPRASRTIAATAAAARCGTWRSLEPGFAWCHDMAAPVLEVLGVSAPLGVPEPGPGGRLVRVPGLPSRKVPDRSRSLTAPAVMPWQIAGPAPPMRAAIPACICPDGCVPSSRVVAWSPVTPVVMRWLPG